MMYSHKRDFDATLVQDLRRSVGWDADKREVWEDILVHTLDVVSVWNGTSLVGVGFLMGNARHAVLCDLTVHPDHQHQGVGSNIVKELLKTIRDKHIAYITLTFDERKPWLRTFYEDCGFEEIRNAMQLRKR